MVDEKPFRVLLDLSELNINVSKYVWMNVSPRELHNIEDLKNAILRKLNFDRRDIKLFVHDGLLPEDEKIIVLRENDTIKLQYEESASLSSSFCVLNSSKISIEVDGEKSEVSEESKVKRSKSKKRKRKTEEVEEDAGDIADKSHKKKSKYSRSVSLEENTSLMKKSHLSRCEHSSSTSVEDNTSSRNVNDVSLENVTKNEEVFFVKNQEPETVFDVYHDTISEVKEPALETSQGTNCKKRKRKRRKKRRDKPEVLSVAPYNIVLNEETETGSSKTFTDNCESIRKHIRFTSPPPHLGSTNELTGSSNLNLTASNGNYKPLNVSESFTPGSSLNKSSTYVNSTPTSEACYENSWDVSPMINEKTLNSDGATVTKGLNSVIIKKKKSYANYPPLNCLPSEGTHIAFKTLDLDESYCPVITPYKEGIVRKVNSKTEELYIEYVQEEVKHGRDGKFENLAKDEAPTDEIVKDVTLKWSSLIEPRCILD